MARWEPDFDVYFSQIEDRPASFVIDLAAGTHAPVATHPVRLTLRIPMKIPRPDGLRHRDEMDALGALEDRFVAALEQGVDAIYVGRVVHGGMTTMYLYVPAQHRAALDQLPSITGSPGDYEPSWSIADDADWGAYLEFLAPGPYDRQTIWNRRLLQVFAEKGDRADQPREVDHLAFFPSREAAERAGEALRTAGFRTDEIDEQAERGFGLQFHRDDHLGEGRADEFVFEILDIVLEEEGSYDGWGAMHVS